MDIFIEQFNNREIATLFWFFVLAIWVFRQQKIREPFGAVFKAFLNWKILTGFIFFTLYIFGIVWGLSQAGLWDAVGHAKDTLIWTTTIALAMFMNVSNVQKDASFFKNAIKDAIKFTIILEFIIGFYPFSLPVEFVLIPVSAFLGGLLAVASVKEEYALARKPLTVLATILGLIILWHAGRNLWVDGGNIITAANVIALLMPALLTVLFLPFVYFFAVISMYETLFMRLKFRNHKSPLLGYAKRKIMWQFGLNLKKLNLWSRQNFDLRVTDKAAVDALIAKPIKTAITLSL